MFCSVLGEKTFAIWNHYKEMILLENFTLLYDFIHFFFYLIYLASYFFPNFPPLIYQVPSSSVSFSAFLIILLISQFSSLPLLVSLVLRSIVELSPNYQFSSVFFSNSSICHFLNILSIYHLLAPLPTPQTSIKTLLKVDFYVIVGVSTKLYMYCFTCQFQTGTLTEDGLDLLCVAPIIDRCFHMPVKKVSSLPHSTLLCGLASCHSLTIIDKQIVGDPLDLKMFESTHWIMEEHDVDDNSKFNMMFPTVLKPPKNRQNPEHFDDHLQIGIIREFPFSSSSQRMGVIVRKLNGQHFEYYAKGSPEMILNFVRSDSVPDDFHDVLETYTQEGYRVIALAHKELKMSYAKVNKVQRDAIEKDMTLLGLIVLENRLKPDTTPCIQALNDANIRVIMVTGDNILTALSVAKDCDIVKPGQSVITVNADSSMPPQLYYTLTNTKTKNSDLSLLSNSASIVSLDTVESQIQSTTVKSDVKKPPPTLFNNYRFAMTGKVWGVVKEYYPELVARLVTRGSVFARMSPEQKQQLVQELQGLGYCVGEYLNDLLAFFVFFCFNGGLNR